LKLLNDTFTTCMKRCPVLLILITLSAGALLIGFLLVRHTRNTCGEALTYNQLYTTSDGLSIKSIGQEGDSILIISFAGKMVRDNNHFKVFYKDSLIKEAHSPGIKFTPVRGIYTYMIEINGSRKVAMTVDYTPVKVYREQHNSSNIIFEVTNTSVPVEQGKLHSIADWAARTPQTDGDSLVSNAYLYDSMHIAKTDGTVEKTLKIARYVLSNLNDAYGAPPDTLSRMDALSQFIYARKTWSYVWCGNHGAIFSFFAERAGIPVRSVVSGRKYGPVSAGDHFFNEVYLKEFNYWAYVDLSTKNIFVKNHDRYLNTIDISRLMKYTIADSGLTSLRFAKGAITSVPLHQADDQEKYYFHASNRFEFYFSDAFERMAAPKNIINRIKNLFQGKPYYAVCTDNYAPGYR
jgi:hypothetical protein